MSQTEPTANSATKDSASGTVKLSLSSTAKPLSFSFQSKKPAGNVAALFSNQDDEDDKDQSPAKHAKTSLSALSKKTLFLNAKAPEPKQMPAATISIQSPKPQDITAEKRLVESHNPPSFEQNPPVKKSRWGETPAEAAGLAGAPLAFSPAPLDSEALKVIEKTAEYVARAGPTLENTIMEKQKDNPQFRFLYDSTLPEAILYRQLLQAKSGAPWQSAAAQSATSSGFSTQQPRASKFSSVPVTSSNYLCGNI